MKEKSCIAEDENGPRTDCEDIEVGVVLGQMDWTVDEEMIDTRRRMGFSRPSTSQISASPAARLLAGRKRATNFGFYAMPGSRTRTVRVLLPESPAVWSAHDRRG